MFSSLEEYFPIQEAVMRLTGGPKLAAVPVFGANMRYFTSEKIYWLRQDFEKRTRVWLESVLTKDSVLYDIGANAGFWEVALTRKCKQIYAFEPAPTNFRRLKEHIQLNDLRNVVLVNVAVSERAGNLRFVENGGISHVAEEGPIQVRAICIDEFVATNPAPTVVKIDVEGHAPQVLAGMSETLSRLHPSLLAELHDESEQEGVSVRLRGHGYRLRVLGRSYPRSLAASA
jgi:FkbM family methyltransferase